jgi:hypothetical protein
MKYTLLLVGLGAGLLIAAEAATAGTCTTEIEALEQALASSDAGMGPGSGTIAETGQLHPPTETMNEATEGKATSPDDVLSQNQNAPTDSEAAEAGQSGTALGAADASASLERARQLDQQGDEAACMTEISKAKSALGAQ